MSTQQSRAGCPPCRCRCVGLRGLRASAIFVRVVWYTRIAWTARFLANNKIAVSSIPGTMTSSPVSSPSSISAQDICKRRCPTCERVFCDEGYRDRHVQNVRCLPVGQVDTYRGATCEENFETADKLRRHLETKKHNRSVKREVKATERLTAVQEKERLDRERARLAAENTEKVLGCDVCGNVTFGSERARVSHFLTKTHLGSRQTTRKEACGTGRGLRCLRQ